MVNMEMLKNNSKRVKGEFKTRILGYVIAAFGLVAGLAWNEAVKGLIDFLYVSARDTLMAKFIYAILMTFVLVLITIVLSKILVNSDE